MKVTEAWKYIKKLETVEKMDTVTYYLIGILGDHVLTDIEEDAFMELYEETRSK